MAGYADSFFGRPSVAAANLLGGDLGAGVRTWMDPGALTPGEAASPAERMKLTGPIGAILNAASDPLLITAMLIGFKFPIPRMVMKAGGKVVSTMFDVAETVSAQNKKLGMLSAPFLRSARSVFRGSDVPEALADIQLAIKEYTEELGAHFGQAIDKYQQQAGRLLTKKDRVLVGAALEKLDSKMIDGFENAKLFEGAAPLFKNLPTDKPFRELVASFKGGYEKAFSRVFGESKVAQDRILNVMRDAERRTLEAQLAALPRESVEFSKQQLKSAVEKLAPNLPSHKASNLMEYLQKKEDYMPHFAVAPERSEAVQTFEGVMKEMMQGLAGEDQQARGMASQITRQIMGSAYKRKGKLVPALADLKEVKEYLNPDTYARLEKFVREKSASAAVANAKGKMAAKEAIAEYGMDAVSATEDYIHQSAHMYGWTGKGEKSGGERLLNALHDFTLRGDTVRANYLKDKLIPAALGKSTHEAMIRDRLWVNSLHSADEWLTKAGEKGWVPKGLVKTMQGWMKNDRGEYSFGHWNRGAAGMLYMGALGGNVASATRNLFQLVLTTGPTVGLEALTKGMSRTWSKANTYFDLRFGAKALGHEEAFIKAFPEYHKAGLMVGTLADEALGKYLDDAAMAVDTGMIKKGASKAKTALMSLFSTTENVNRLVTFESGVYKAVKDGATLEEAIPLARRLVSETQFVAGVENTPLGLIGKSPLVRQFTQFPLRFLEFTTSAAMRLGSAQKALGDEWGPLRGLNPGTAARMYIWSDLVSEFANAAFGTNLDQSLMMGALPGFTDRGPFAPLPVKPPALSVIGAPMMDIAAGDMSFRETRHALPLLVPGGLGIGRAAGMIPGGQGIAQFLDRKYADFSQPTPDGKYPIMTGQGNLVGFFSPAQMLMMGTGLSEGGSAVQSEQEMYSFLVKNRERITGYKNEYVQMVSNSDTWGASRLSKEFEQDVPGVGPLENLISKEDFIREQNRRSVTRLEKLLDTMPPEVRPMYAWTLQTALGSLGPDLMGLDPGALTQYPTAAKRKPMRNYQWQEGGGQGFQSNMGPLSVNEMPFQQISYGGGTSGFDAFTGFE